MHYPRGHSAIAWGQWSEWHNLAGFRMEEGVKSQTLWAASRSLEKQGHVDPWPAKGTPSGWHWDPSPVGLTPNCPECVVTQQSSNRHGRHIPHFGMSEKKLRLVVPKAKHGKCNHNFSLTKSFCCHRPSHVLSTLNSHLFYPTSISSPPSCPSALGSQCTGQSGPAHSSCSPGFTVLLVCGEGALQSPLPCLWFGFCSLLLHANFKQYV